MIVWNAAIAIATVALAAATFAIAWMTKNVADGESKELDLLERQNNQAKRQSAWPTRA